MPVREGISIARHTSLLLDGRIAGCRTQAIGARQFSSGQTISII